MRLKIQSQKGFSISEMLMVVLMISLVGAVIAGGVTVVKNSYTTITQKAEAQTLRSTALTTVMNEMRYAQNIGEYTDTDNLTYIAFDSPSRGYRIYYKDGSQEEGILVANTQGTAAVPLVTDKTITNKLTLHIEYKFDETDETAPAHFKLWIWVTNSAGNVLAGKESSNVSEGDYITITPLNS